MRSILLVAGILPLAAQAISIQTDAVHEPTCTSANGRIFISVYGGTAPFSFDWSDGPTEEDRSGLAAGTYSVTVTDALSETAEASFTLVQQGWIQNAGFSFVVDGQAYFPCPGQTNARLLVPVNPWPEQNYYGSAGTPPFFVSMTLDGVPATQQGIDANGNPWFGFASAGQEAFIEVMDADGCSGTMSQLVSGPPVAGMVVDEVQPACGGQPTGAIHVLDAGANGWMPSFRLRDGGGNIVEEEPYFFEQQWITGLASGEYVLEILYGGLGAPVCNGEFLPAITVPDLGADCGVVQGNVYLDHDQDCMLEPTDDGIPYRIVDITPGPYHAITNADGGYSVALPNGTYTFAVQDPDGGLVPICPAVQPFEVVVNTVPQLVDVADSSSVPLDIETQLYAGPARPGFSHHVHARVSNTSGQLSAPTTVEVTFDPAMAFVSAIPAPSSVTGNVLHWALPALGAFAMPSFHIVLNVPPDVGLLGQPFTHTVHADQVLTETTLANNTAVADGIYTGSYDPNDKQVRALPSGNTETFILGTDEWLDYTIRFQNTGTDTAFTVVVTDTLSEALDMGTFQQGLASHPFTVAFKPQRVVEWRFADILLPDSNTNEAFSHGVVTFRIKPVQPLLPGTLLNNAADIFFDFNPPVRTNDAVLVAELSTWVPAVSVSALGLAPNPAIDHLIINAAKELRVVRLLTLDGRVAREQATRGRTVVMELGGLGSGTYVVEAVGDEGGVFRQRFVKQ